MFEKRPKIVAFGGGTGLSLLLKGLKDYPVDLTAIVTVTDDGGSSGKMREIFKMPPPGDLRKVLVALSKNEDVFDDLFNYRFKADHSAGFGGHTVGNIIIAALQDINNGDFSDAIKGLSEILNIQGEVIPLADEQVTLYAKYKDGTIVEGESKISKTNKIIDVVYVDRTNIEVNKEVISAIYDADMIVFAQGSLFTSLIPNLVFEEVQEAISKCEAKVVYIANIMTQNCETKNFDLKDHIDALERHIGNKLIDSIIYNDDTDVPEDVYKRYSLVGQDIVYPNIEKLQDYKYNFISSRLLIIDKKGRIRHNYRKIAANVFSLLLDK